MSRAFLRPMVLISRFYNNFCSRIYKDGTLSSLIAISPSTLLLRSECFWQKPNRQSRRNKVGTKNYMLPTTRTPSALVLVNLFIPIPSHSSSIFLTEKQVFNSKLQRK